MKTPHFLFTATMLFLSVNAFSQVKNDNDEDLASTDPDKHPVLVYKDFDDVGSLHLMAEYKYYTHGFYTILLEYNEIANCDVEREEVYVIKSSGRFRTIRAENKAYYPNVSFGYWAIRGYVDPPRVDSMIAYRLPYSKTLNVAAGLLSKNVYESLFGQEYAQDVTAYQFKLNDGDTVFAARKGTVVRVIDKYDPRTDLGEISIAKGSNYVIVQHEDGTEAEYDVLKKGSIFVQKGDVVFPGTPLALAGSYDGKVYQTRFCVYFLTLKYRENRPFNTRPVNNVYIDPYFATSNGNVRLINGTSYRPVETEELITREMNKKELKKYHMK